MRAAVIGAGVMGKSVVEHLLECSRVQGIIAYDIREAPLDEFRTKYGIDVTTDLQAVLCR